MRQEPVADDNDEEEAKEEDADDLDVDETDDVQSQLGSFELVYMTYGAVGDMQEGDDDTSAPLELAQALAASQQVRVACGRLK